MRSLIQLTQLCLTCEPFVQHAFEKGDISLRSVKAVLHALAERHYVLLGHIRPAWRLITSWERGEPLDMRTPLPFTAWRAMFATTAIWGWFAYGVALGLGFHCLLRPGEILGLTWADILLGSRLHSSDGCGVVALRQPKTRFTGGRVQHVLILCDWLAWYLASVKAFFQPNDGDRVVPFS